jgi:ATP-binding cassette, subfamily C (CFTR/MRP), member 1
MNAVERITQYSHGNNVEQEASHEPTKYPLPKAWPSKGTLELNDVVMSYRTGLPPVLKGISMSIGGGEKVGVVGRTGAGKTVSFTFYRGGYELIPNSRSSLPCIGSRSCLLGQSPSTGEREGPYISFLLTSDFRVDVSKIGLRDLRSKIAIIPQEPVLFQGR